MQDYVIAAAMIAQTMVYAGTLWVLIAQTRALKKSYRSSNYGHVVSLLKDLRMLRIQCPELAKVYPSEVEGLDVTEIQYHFFNLIVLSILELVYYDRKQGVIDDHTWRFWLDAIEKIANEESFRRFLERQSYKIVDPDFLKVLQKLQR